MKPEDLGKELDATLSDFLHANFIKRQDAVQAAAEVYKDKLEAASPRDSGEYAASWAIKTKYPDRRYVGNTKTVDGKGKDGRYRTGIPLSSILENDPQGKPIMRETYESCVDELYATIKNKLNE